MRLLVSILASDLLPIFAIAGAGFLLARYAGVGVKTLSRVVFYARSCRAWLFGCSSPLARPGQTLAA
jgi:hypothetical protein